MIQEGQNLIVSVDGSAIAFSTDCTIDTSAELGERKTKESASGVWPEKYVKSLSEQIKTSQLLVTDEGGKPTYDLLKSYMLARKAVTLSYAIREGSTREGKASGGYTGSYLISSLSLSGSTGEDGKYDATFDSSGEVKQVEAGKDLNGAAYSAATTA